MKGVPVRGLQVEEYHVAGKKGDDGLCEDAIVVNDRFLAVLDGTTSHAPEGHGLLSPGKKAVNRMAAVLNDVDGNTPARPLFRRLNDAIADIYREEGLYDQARENPEIRYSAAVIVYSRAHSEVWMIGDCQALIGDTLFCEEKHADTLLSEVRAMFLESELLRGKSIEDLLEFDTGRQYIRELAIRQKQFRNRLCAHRYCFFVLDGFLSDLDSAIQAERVPPDCTRLVLASDGYPVLKPTLAETEQVLREMIERDPLCFREFKSTKGVYSGNVSFDDRAYLRVNLSTEQQ